MLVRIYSDVVCPWCWIGKRRWERALDAFVAAGHSRHDVRVEYLPFQLDPGAPSPGQPLTEVYERKFGGPDRAAAVIAQVTDVAAAEGLEYHLDRAWRANTFDAHRLVWLAGRTGPQSEVKERLMRAYFTDGDDVSDHAVLGRCAADVGLERDDVDAVLRGGDGSADVSALLDRAREVGITAVPTYVFSADDAAPADGFALPGAQDSDTFLRVLSRLDRSSDAPA